MKHGRLSGGSSRARLGWWVAVWALLTTVCAGSAEPPTNRGRGATTGPAPSTIVAPASLPIGRATRLGTNDLIPLRPLYFKAPLTAYAKAQLAGLGTQVSAVSAVLYLPSNWEAPGALPLFVICSSSGSPAIPQVPAYTNAAMSAGWAVLAAEGPPLPMDKDTVLWNWGTVSSALEYLERSIPRARAWPVAVGGFSGGSKRAACVAAAFAQSRRRLLGIFMGGCNEDRATTGALLFNAGPAFTSAPVFLSNGLDDGIAGPAHGAAVKIQMERSGFNRVRLETYPSGHRLHPPHVEDALAWFSECAAETPKAVAAPRH